MDPLAPIGNLAARSVSLDLGALTGAIGVAGQDPTPATATAQAQTGTQSDAAIAVLRQVLDLESSEGAQLAQMVAGSVDIVG